MSKHNTLTNSRKASCRREERSSTCTATANVNALTREQTARVRRGRVRNRHICGMGEIITAQIDAEIGDWNRFANRRQIASYTGLCPGVSASGKRFATHAITKHGNRRLRAALVELAWLIVRYQPLYRPACRCREVLETKNRAASKKAIVALARQLAVDLWRLNTGRLSVEQLQLVMSS